MSERRFYESPAEGTVRRSAPAAIRNRDPIFSVLRDWLPDSGTVLEVASGTGEHSIYFAEAFPKLEWQPSDIHAGALASIAAWREESGLPNVRRPIVIDASKPGEWPIDAADVVLNINMAHISPWDASLGLIAGAAMVLRPGCPLILYGPWLKEDVETAQSNLDFDADLRSRNPRWGLRRVEDFAAEASAQGLELIETRAMPANNLMLLFRLRGAP